jgi:hypothetical protein
MIRKLVITVFALSFAALGCGSDSGNPAKTDSAASEAGSKDQASGLETQATDAPAVDVQIGPDGPAIDVPQSPVDGAVDAPPAVDTAPHADGGAPAVDAQVGEAAPAVDAGSVG